MPHEETNNLLCNSLIFIFLNITACPQPGSIKTCTLTVNTVGEGAVLLSPASSSGEYTIGTIVTLMADPDEFAAFTKWTGDIPVEEQTEFSINLTMDSDKTVGAEFTHNVWTIMVYLDADNDLEYYGINDLNEMEGAYLEETGITVIALVDRTPGYYSGSGDWTNTRLYQVRYDAAGKENDTIVSRRLASTELGLTTTGDEELNLGDPDTAIDFIDYCKANHSADNYAFIIWNHGDGWEYDSVLDTFMTHEDLSAAYRIQEDTDYADTEAAALIDAIDDAVYYEWHDSGTADYVENTDATGLAIHLVVLDGDGHAEGHSEAYVKYENPTVSYPLSFVADSQWVIIDGDNDSGLLYRLWYELF